MTTHWHGCYADNWNGIITPDAFAHPAKFARGLIRRIYSHMMERGYIAIGDSVIDPFGGIAAGAYDALLFGLHWTGCELEPRFVELGNANIDKYRHDLRMLNGRLGTARLLQGDSRRLGEVVESQMAASICSPPYSETHVADGEAAALAAAGKARLIPDGASSNGVRYGSTPGQLGTMRSGDYTAAVSSPPYADAINNTGEGPGARHDPIYHNGDNAFKQTSANGYGREPGNLGNLPGDGFGAAVSSPPFENSDNRGAAAMPDDYFVRANGQPFGEGADSRALIGDTPGNIGNDTGDTFWSAARLITEQVYSVLKPGGYTAWVCKDFVRNGQRVPFSDQWQALCAAVGFIPVERIHAMLVEERGEQLDIFGGVTVKRVERKSFFRRLAEKKGSPRIDHEDVIIMRKPL